jgi:acyl-CoA synthetase (NDP forming)
VLEYDYPKKAILAYSQLLKQKNWEKQEEYVLEKNQLPNDRIIDNLKEKIKKETKLCSNDLSSEILQSFQIPVLEEVLVRS